jgi:hypothetical protein
MSFTPLGSPYSRGDSTSTFDTTIYGNDPWSGITQNQRIYYDPVLRDVYRWKAVFAQYCRYQQSLEPYSTKTMVVSQPFDIHANFNRLALRDMSLPASHFDSRNLQISFDRYGGKVAYHAYDELINYWRWQGPTASAIRRIVNDKLGQHMVDVQDLLARNAMLSTSFKLFGNGSATDFSGITTDDKITTFMLNNIHLGMKYRGVPYAQMENGSVGNVICLASPGQIFDLQQQTDPKDWLIPMAYGDPSRLLNYEVGTYRNVRFVESPKCTLFNCGKIQIQTTITSAVNAGDGSPDPTSTQVDGTYFVGQPAATHYIQLANTTDMTQFALNDIVSVHVQRTSNYGITNGVDFKDGLLQNRRIVNIDSGNYRLSFEKPIMTDLTTNLGSGVYGYVTKGQHIHSAIFVGGDDGIIMGIGRPPRLHFPPPIDDFDSIWRFSWDSYQGYQMYNPNVLEVLFGAASFRLIGPMLAG